MNSRAMNGQDRGSLAPEVTTRLNHYFQVDNERQTFMQNMLQNLDASAKRIQDLELDLEDQKDSRLKYQSEAIRLKDERDRIYQTVKKDSYVVVLIDGDGAKFADEFLRDGARGAERAAIRLKQAVLDHLRDTGAVHDDVRLLVRVYANLNDLAKSLRMSHVINFDDDMRLFAESFTNSRADFDFVNVGKGKENADSKMRRMLNHYFYNFQCQKVFLAGCCHDNGYLHDLRCYTGINDDKIVLVETTPAEPAFKSLGFSILRFSSVFRCLPLNNETKHFGQPVPVRPRSPSQTTPGPIARPVQQSAPPVQSVQPLPPPGFQSPVVQEQNPISPMNTQSPQNVTSPSPIQPKPAAEPRPPARVPSVVSSGNGGTSISYATAGGAGGLKNVTVKAPKPKKQPKVRYTNDDNYRIDAPTQHPPRTPSQTSYQAKFASIRPSVFCNDYYLKGRCKWGISCDKTHDTELTGPELAIHRYKARTSLCPSGPWCEDYDCYLSHHCPRAPCTRGDQCPFYHTDKFGDLHLSKDQLQPANKWTEGSDLPEHIG
ncbi:hypothetical protein F4778DRAFT_544149 [Xylariomycetidae sp. FL2044]|nr:hypothetical protein F4778DRAFT_544149 [Xylariomycetidae sp. FL2044]